MTEVLAEFLDILPNSPVWVDSRNAKIDHIKKLYKAITGDEYKGTNKQEGLTDCRIALRNKYGYNKHTAVFREMAEFLYKQVHKIDVEEEEEVPIEAFNGSESKMSGPDWKTQDDFINMLDGAYDNSKYKGRTRRYDQDLADIKENIKWRDDVNAKIKEAGLGRMSKSKMSKYSDFTPYDSNAAKWEDDMNAYNNTNLNPMQHLLKIVSGLKKDIAQVKEAQSLASANKWIEEAGLTGMYRAEEKDLDADGVNEVVVRDIHGMPVLINGYGLKNSRFPYRQAYYAANPSKADRKAQKYSDWLDELYDPIYDFKTNKFLGYAGEGHREFEQKAIADKYTDSKDSAKLFPRSAKKLSAFQAFTKLVITPIVKAVRSIFQDRNTTVVTRMPEKYATTVWNNLVIYPILKKIYPENTNEIDGLIGSTDAADKKILKRMMSKPEVRKYEKVFVQYFHENLQYTANMIDMLCDKAFENHAMLEDIKSRAKTYLASYMDKMNKAANAKMWIYDDPMDRMNGREVNGE